MMHETNHTAVTFYHQQVIRLTKELYPRDYLTQQVIKAKHFIDDHFAENIDLNNIAVEAHFSKFHFIRLFRSLYGVSPYQYLIAVRIANAKQLLQQNNCVTDVCFSVGFASIPSFTLLFKKTTGYTPAAFKQKKRNFQ
jgi:AraC-like DNA-binding protein